MLVRLLTHEDRWLRVKAANALKNMGDTAKPVVPDMLKAVAKTAEPLQPIVWADPIQLTHGELAAALFKGLLRSSSKEIDPELLYPAVRAISRNADGMARATLRRPFREPADRGGRAGPGAGHPRRRPDALPGGHDVRQ